MGSLYESGNPSRFSYAGKGRVSSSISRSRKPEKRAIPSLPSRKTIPRMFPGLSLPDAISSAQRLFPLSDHGEVHRGEAWEKRPLQGGNVGTSEDGTDAGQRRPGRFGDPDSVEKTRCGATDAEEGGALREEVVADRAVGTGAGVAVDDGGPDAPPFEVCRDARKPERRHDVGDPRYVRGSGAGAIAEGMDEQDPFGIQHPGSFE